MVQQPPVCNNLFRSLFLAVGVSRMRTLFLPHLLYLVIISFTCALIFVYPRTCAQVFCCMLRLRSIIRKSYCHVACWLLLMFPQWQKVYNSSRLCGYVKMGLSTTPFRAKLKKLRFPGRHFLTVSAGGRNFF